MGEGNNECDSGLLGVINIQTEQHLCLSLMVLCLGKCNH